MKTRVIFALLGMIGITGCGETLTGLGNFFGTISTELTSLGTCLSPLDPEVLNDVFAQAVPVKWAGETIELTDEFQTGVGQYYSEHLGGKVLPEAYLNERFFQLGPLAAGDAVQVEVLEDVVSDIRVFDAEFTLLAYRQAHDFNGYPGIFEIPITQNSTNHYLHLNLAYLSDTKRPVVRITRKSGKGIPKPDPQTVVLHFTGQTGVVYRSEDLMLTDVEPLDDPLVREAAIESFKETFAQFNLTVLTDQDVLPSPPFSVIYIGRANPPFGHLGLAEWVDGGNRLRDDVAIVDINNAILSLARLFGPQTFGRAIGKVAAHEMGHLLGLVHVVDQDDIMTGAGCQGSGLDVERLLAKQFKKSLILSFYCDVCNKGSAWEAVGYQDGIRSLLDTLGSADTTGP